VSVTSVEVRNVVLKLRLISLDSFSLCWRICLWVVSRDVFFAWSSENDVVAVSSKTGTWYLAVLVKPSFTSLLLSSLTASATSSWVVSWDSWRWMVSWLCSKVCSGYPVQRRRPPVMTREAASRRARDSGTLSGTSAEEER